MNYDLMMQEQMKNIPKGSKLLLHACCAPCSSAVLEKLSSYFEISILYYNPNITEEEEYTKRLKELYNFVEKYQTVYPVSIIEGRYNVEEWFGISKGLEAEPERGKRCYKCYQLRLEEAAKVADSYHIPYFCTTLTLSPHKNSTWVNDIGEDLDKKYTSTYLYSDFKKREGYKRSIELSREYQLYRQDYCGCIYSKKDKMY